VVRRPKQQIKQANINYYGRSTPRACLNPKTAVAVEWKSLRLAAFGKNGVSLTAFTIQATTQFRFQDQSTIPSELSVHFFVGQVRP